MRTLKVNEAKLISGNTFIIDLAALGGEKKYQNMTTDSSFGAPH